MAVNAGSATRRLRTSKLSGRKMTMGASADLSWRKMHRDFVRATSKGNSVCACRARRSAGSRTAEYLRRTDCQTHLGLSHRYHVYFTHGQASGGAWVAQA